MYGFVCKHCELCHNDGNYESGSENVITFWAYMNMNIHWGTGTGFSPGTSFSPHQLLFHQGFILATHQGLVQQAHLRPQYQETQPYPTDPLVLYNEKRFDHLSHV